ncbi:MAG: hypothetical protein ACU83N_16305 [Gammaproteobacteria bacterium]
MSNNACTHETLVNSKYCRLTLCRDCGIIQFNLPYRLSLQFEIAQFLEIADAFGKGAHQVRKANAPSLSDTAEVIELNKSIH